MPELSSYEVARDWLYSLKNRGSKYGIDRMERFAEVLGHPQRAYPCIHVAGTNGKGSTCAMLERIFRDRGFKVGLSTSPHLVRQGERIQVDRRLLEESQILEYVRELLPFAEQVAQADPELHPSFFEFMTAMAFLHFKREGVDLAVVEVGLGGRLDATNVVLPEVSVITSIALDHTEILGDTLAAIAGEKGGIIKAGIPVVAGLLEPEALAVIRKLCRERGCVLHSIEERYGSDLAKYPKTNLYGSYQRINAAIAMTVVEVLLERFGLDAAKAELSLRSVAWPGRWEERELEHRKIVFDVSHNSEGARFLDESLAELTSRCGGAKPDVVMGVMGMSRASALVPVAAKWAHSLRFVRPQQDRACSFEELRSLVPDCFVGEVLETTVSALFPAKGVCSLDGASDRPLVISGSIYLIGEIWDRFFEESPLGQGALQDF